jgi:hypothetical protein
LFPITNDAFRNMGIDDCELAQEIARQILPSWRPALCGATSFAATRNCPSWIIIPSEHARNSVRLASAAI